MELIELENIAKKEKLNIANLKLIKHKSKIVQDYIFMDYSKIHTYTEEKCILAEEIGHYYYDAFYTLSSSQADIDRAEYKAFKWKTLACVPRKSILECFKQGITNIYDIATELQVEPYMVKFAYDYYKRNA